MAHLAIFVAGITFPTAPGGDLNVTGIAFASNMTTNDAVSWDVELPWDSTEAAANQAITDAAEAAVETAGFDIGVLDNRLLMAAGSTV